MAYDKDVIQFDYNALVKFLGKYITDAAQLKKATDELVPPLAIRYTSTKNSIVALNIDLSLGGGTLTGEVILKRDGDSHTLHTSAGETPVGAKIPPRNSNPPLD